MTTLTHSLPHFYRLARMDKPIGSLLLLWPTLWALWFASNGVPALYLLFAFIVGVFLMRSAGCVFNDLADRNFDGHVERTRERPLVTGAVTPRQAIVFALILCLLAACLLVPMNQLTWLLALPALWLAASYPLTKRFFPLPQAYLGIAFGFGIPMGYAAVLGTIPADGWVMLAANIFWALAYDTEYAMVDRNDDIHLGIHSSALTFGRFDVAAVMCCYALTLLLLACAGWMAQRGGFWFAGLIGAAMIAAYHYTLIRGRERKDCFRAFMHNNWFGACIFAGVVLDTL
ncbi:MAG: 4-hydroxybenzoate octaprenyltransferase [Rhodocyclaceae bacterium]|nr:4-hydroxybenzoate octaprenyltransferase [Rhodocyclaceae bacterium]